jgi:hypothetical protein
MADTFYHLDRRTDLEAGDVVDLEPHESALGVDDEDALEALFPGGLAGHGRHYCGQDLYAADDADLWDVSCELLFELVRAARYPERPSRFQSVFGFRARRDLERFVDSHVEPPYTVWRVTAADAFLADMKLVEVGDVAGGVARADRYWRGRTEEAEPLWEALLVPPVEVRERVETVPE